MNETTAKRHVKNFLQDLMHCASFIQNNPDRIAKIILTDPDTDKELSRLTGDLFSLIEVIEADASQTPGDSGA